MKNLLRKSKFARNAVAFYRRTKNNEKRLTRQIIGEGRDLLIIAPGEMEIPNNGWGAVEFLLWKQFLAFTENGMQVTILNSWFHRDWIRCFTKRPTAILLHYDIFSKRCFFYKIFYPKIPIYVVSHFGYAAFPEKYSQGYRKTLKWISRMNVIIALSPAVKLAYENIGIKRKIEVIPNGANVSDFKTNKKVREIICLGKIEPRKLQIELSKAISDEILIDFVGPFADERLSELSSEQRKRFLGPWSREKVINELSKYKVLVLLSDGEADALVLYEAQAAGCSIVISSNAAGSQNLVLPWVYVVDDWSKLRSTLKEAIEFNKIFSNQIIEYARKNYSWSDNITAYRRLIESGTL
jgi:glycosyltransferase involved in cell wall biosynthesis